MKIPAVLQYTWITYSASPSSLSISIATTDLTMSERACASPSIFSRSRFVVGSSRARRPQLMQNVSARASRMMMDARTWTEVKVGYIRSAMVHQLTSAMIHTQPGGLSSTGRLFGKGSTLQVGKHNCTSEDHLSPVIKSLFWEVLYYVCS